jgi:hypothetical protein
MAIVFPITNTQALAVLPALLIDSSPDVASDPVAKIIARDQSDIINICKKNGYIFTGTTPHQTAILALCNLFTPQADIVLRRGSGADPDNFLTWSESLESASDYLKELLRTNDLLHSFINGAANTIPLTSIITAVKVAQLIPSFVPRDGPPATKPSAAAIQEMADCFSALVYSIAQRNGYPVPASAASLTADQFSIYSDIVLFFTASFAVQTRASEFAAGSKIQHKLAKKYFDSGAQKLTDLQQGKNFQLFAA